jgi:hypothetical protein
MVFLFNWIAKILYGEDYEKHVNKPVKRKRRRK